MLTENDVVVATSRFLKEAGFQIEQALSTKERGVDLIATRGNERILVEAKGATSSKSGSPPKAQRRVGFHFERHPTHYII